MQTTGPAVSRHVGSLIHGALFAAVAWSLFPAPRSALGIELNPTLAEVAAALQRGAGAAAQRLPPDRLYAWFGSDNDLEPRGFLMTKLVGLTVMAAHFALRAQAPNEQEIRQILDEPTLLVSVFVFGDRQDFAVDSYMVIVQGPRTVKPVRVRFDGTGSRTSVWPARPAYRAKVIASFLYEELDPKAPSTLSVFPGGGREIMFDLDFSKID